MGIMTRGITIYIVIAESKAEEIFSPSILANEAVEKKASQ
jgi:hypothetical protein